MPVNSPPIVNLDELEFDLYLSREFSHFSDAIFDAPEKTLENLKTLWGQQKGMPIDGAGYLCNAFFVLELCFREESGYATEEDMSEDFIDFENKAKLWESCLAVNFPITLIDILTDEKFFEQPFIWVKSVISLNSAMARIWTSSSHPRALCQNTPDWPVPAKSLLESYFRKIGTVWDIIWRERDVLLYSPKQSWPPESIPIQVLIMFAYTVTFLHTRLYPEYQKRLTRIPAIVRTLLAAWARLVSTVNLKDREFFEHHLFTFAAVNEHYRSFRMLQDASTSWRSAIDPAMDVIKPLVFMRACCTALLDSSDMIRLSLSTFLQVLGHIVFYDNASGDLPSSSDMELPSRKAFWAVPMLRSIAEALERNANSVAQGWQAVTISLDFLVCEHSCQLLQFTLQGLFRVGNPPVSDGESIYKTLSQCLRTLNATLDAEVEIGTKDVFLMKLQSALVAFQDTCSAATACMERILPTPVQNKALVRIALGFKAAARESWYSDMRLLRSRPRRNQFGGNESYQSLVRTWTVFGKAFGFTETAERDKRKAQSKHLCAWVECKFYSQPSPAPLFTCSGCGEQSYCSRECQKRDWKRGGHREECRRVKA